MDSICIDSTNSCLHALDACWQSNLHMASYSSFSLADINVQYYHLQQALVHITIVVNP